MKRIKELWRMSESIAKEMLGIDLEEEINKQIKKEKRKQRLEKKRDVLKKLKNRWD